MDGETMGQQVIELAAAKLAERAEVRGILASRVAEILRVDLAKDQTLRDEVVRHLSERVVSQVTQGVRDEARPQVARLLAQALGVEVADYARRLVAALPEPAAASAPAPESDRWMVVWHTDTVTHVTVPMSRAEAEEHYESLKMGWSEVYLVRVERGPGEV